MSDTHSCIEWMSAWHDIRNLVEWSSVGIEFQNACPPTEKVHSHGMVLVFCMTRDIMCSMLFNVHIVCSMFTSCAQCSHHMLNVHIMCSMFTSCAQCSHHVLTGHFIGSMLTSCVQCSHLVLNVHIMCSMVTSLAQCSHHVLNVHIMCSMFTSCAQCSPGFSHYFWLWWHRTLTSLNELEVLGSIH